MSSAYHVYPSLFARKLLRKLQYTFSITLYKTTSLSSDEIRMGCYRNFFAAVNLISGAEDAASNFGRGYFHLSSDLLQPSTNSMRKLAEQCDGLQGIMFHRAYGGGTGTGFACSLLSALNEEYFKTPCIDLGIMPSLTMACGPVEPYNALLSCEIPIEDVSLAMMMDNKALMNVCGKKLATYRPTFTNFNRIIAQTMSGLTASFRFSGLSNMNICDLRTNLVPYPEAHFALSAFAPFCVQESLDRWAPTTGHLTDEVFSPANQLISHNGEQPIYLSCCVFYRGKTSVREVNATLERMRRSGDLPLVDWCPTGFKVSARHLVLTVGLYRIGQSGTSVVALHNSTLFRDPLHNLVHAFNMLIERRAFLHWFLAEGLEEDEFRQALEGIRKLEDDYTQV
ncbi:unnamed protein product [Schistocephalus solidus]|uniref:Tubulin/FtsZ GTPase domain-containing protein n=1 Tax=Schistocephalus solidus TaxID=70667 RepID=A0A3P7BU80_SCHSO|nr:unnamed protein product [Schistocephalus solidus]